MDGKCDCDALRKKEKVALRAMQMLIGGEINIVWEIFDELKTADQRDWGSMISAASAQTAMKMAKRAIEMDENSQE